MKILILNIVKHVSEIIWKKNYFNFTFELQLQIMKAASYQVCPNHIFVILHCNLSVTNWKIFFHPQKIDIVTFHNACRRFCKCSLSFCDVDFADCLKVLGANLARGWSQRERVFQCLLESILNLTNSNKTTAQRDNTLEAGWVTITKLISWISWLNFFAAN